MTKRNVATASVVALALALLLTFSTGFAMTKDAQGLANQGQAANGQHWGGKFAARRLAMVATMLDLTDAQKTQAQTILNNAMQQAKPYAEQVRQGHKDLAAAVKSGATAQQIQAIADAQAPNLAKLIAIRATALSQFYATLNPDQKAKADKLHGMFMGRFGEFGGGHGRGR